MGSIFNRGTKERPLFYLKYKDAGGSWKMASATKVAANLGKPTRGRLTRKEARVILDELEERIGEGLPAVDKKPLCGELIEKWRDSLTNRSAADDKSRINKHVLPKFRGLRVDRVTLPVIMAWIDEQRAASELEDATIRHNLNLLSRFFSWAVERGHTTFNPVRQIPTGKRPRQSPKRAVAYIDDDSIVRKLIGALPEPIGLMFYLGNRSGLRLGEHCGLRMSDLGFLDEGVIRVRYSYDAPLKEDKNGEGKCKWAPAPDDIEAVLEDWLARRQAQGAGPENLVFPRADGKCYTKEQIEDEWDDVAADLVGKRPDKFVTRNRRKGKPLIPKPAITWYEATRHSFVSRNLAAGASLDEVSAAVGHSSPVVTRRYYDHFVRRIFSDALRSGLGIAKMPTGSMVSLRQAR